MGRITPEQNYEKYNPNVQYYAMLFINYIHLIQSLPYLLPCCWLLARLLVDGLVAAKRAAVAEDAGTVGNGIDVDGMELKCPSI